MTNSIHLEGNPGNGWQFAGACKTADEAQAALKLRQEQYPECEWRIVYPTESARALHISQQSAMALYAAMETLVEYWDNGTPVHPGSDVAADARAALAKARGLKGGE